MNRNALGVLTIAAVFSFVLTGPRSTSPSSSDLASASDQVSSVLHRYPPNAETAGQPCSTQAENYRAHLIRMIHNSFSTGSSAPLSDSPECEKMLGLESENLQRSHVLFALVPDPVHTHLALFFDRQIDALQQGAQDSGWVFERARMPWDNKKHSEPSDFLLRLSEVQSQERLEQQPGLMIFRHSPAPDHSEVPDRLMVLIIGETPTAGVNKSQFRNALNLIEPVLKSHPKDAIAILGPTFSGSLQSLADLLNCSSSSQSFACSLRPYIISGTVSDYSSVAAFNAKFTSIKSPPVFQTLQEYDLYAIDRFLKFAKGGYTPEEVAILSEDETGYGQGSQRDPPRPGQAVGTPGSDEAAAVHLYFPREISQLRGAYQRRSTASSTRTDTQIRATLPLDLEATGSEADSVPEYAFNQTPLSQEAVLLGIVTELKRHSIRVVLVRATDPLDLMFLARYLRSAYPQGRIVTVGSDLLFGREVQDALFHGVMALTTYTLTPGADHRFEPIREFHSDRVFPASSSVGTYNAIKLMLASVLPATLVQPSPAEPAPEGCKDKPRLHLAEYFYPRPTEEPQEEPTHPPVHLTVLGHDGFWNITILPQGEAPHGLFATIFHRWTRQAPDRAASVWNQNRSSLPLICDPEAKSASVSGPTHRRLPLEWHLFWVVAIVIAVGYAYVIWTASILSSSPAVAHLAPPIRDSRRHLFAITGYLHFALLAALLWASEYYANKTVVEFLVLLASMLLVILVCSRDLLRRGSPLLARVFLVVCVLTLAWMSHIWSAGYIDYMFVLRSVNLGSGVSPLFPILLLLAAGLWGSWYTLSGTALVDERSRLPALPAVRDLGGTSINPEDIHLGILEDDHTTLLKYLRPNYVDSRTVIFAVLVLLAVLYLAGGIRLVYTLEKQGYERLLSLFMIIILILLVSSAFRLMGIWRKLRQLLMALDSLPLRRGFKLLKGFSWSPLWQIGVVNLKQLSYREIDALNGIIQQEAGHYQDILLEFHQVAARVNERYDQALRSSAGREGWQFVLSFPSWMRRINNQVELERQLLDAFHTLQRTLAKASLYALDFIRHNWLLATAMCSDESGSSVRLSRAIQALRASRAERQTTAEEDRLRNQLDACLKYLALVYTIFVIAVLIRIRNLVVAMGGLYVFFLVGLSIYPFQPQLNIRIWMMALLGFMVVIVGTVYGQMHRDATLSNITDTKPGELGGDFWIRLASFIAVPLLSLFASQFPEITSTLNSWLEPAINAFK